MTSEKKILLTLSMAGNSRGKTVRGGIQDTVTSLGKISKRKVDECEGIRKKRPSIKGKTKLPRGKLGEETGGWALSLPVGGTQYR